LLRNFAVMHIAGREHQDKRTTFVVADGVELGVAATLGEADTMGQGPPFAPPAQRWTLMHELSMNSRSGISSLLASAAKMRCQTPRSDQRTKRL
jgi:hypothetical protein